MNFFKKMIGLGGDLESLMKNSKFEGTFYKVIKGARNIILAQCTVSFNQKNSAYFICLEHNQQAYEFPIYLQMNPVSFKMNKNGKENVCFQWTLTQDNQHVGCYMNPDKKDKFKQILCQILRKVVNDDNIKDHLDFCKQLSGIPIYKQAKQSQLSASSKISVNTKEQLNAVLIKQASKQQNKIVHTALCYQIVKNQRKLIQQNAVFALKSIGNFNYEFNLINQTGYCFLKKQITPSLVYQINTDSGYLKWLDLDKQYSKIVQINFENRRDAAMSLKFALMECMYEINTKRKLTDAVAEDQMTYLKRINQNNTKRDVNMSIVKVYSQKQDIENIEQKNFVYGNQQAKKGLQKYRTVTQAKIGDFDLTSLGSMIQTLRINEDNQIKSISHHRLFGKQNIQVDPTILLLHDNDNKVMALEKKGNLIYHDLNKQKLINQYKIDQKGLIDIHPEYKLAETSPYQSFKAISYNSIYQIDPRLKEGTELFKKYTTDTSFNTMSVDQKGNYALGSSSGEIRLYNKIGSNANCKYSSFGDKVLHLESTKDGKWLLATFAKFLILLPTQTQDQQSLYQKKIPFSKRLDPIKLTIKLEHLQLCKIQDLNFIPAKFDESNANRQKYIVGGFGDYVAIWNLSQVLKGDYWNYKFTKTSGRLLQADFKYNDVKKLIMVNDNGINVKQNKVKPN